MHDAVARAPHLPRRNDPRRRRPRLARLRADGAPRYPRRALLVTGQLHGLADDPQALAYDAAYQAAGGEGAPFLDAFGFQLQGVLDQQDACRRQLADAIADVARESGEAIAATIEITRSHASPLSTLRASAEVGQLLAAAQRLAKRLVPFLPNGAGSLAGNTEGDHQ